MGMSLSEMGSILAMQGFNGLSLFCVLLLMALGLAIIFGQMGVINMAHGEFMTVGAYTTFVASHVASNYFPALAASYFLIAIAGAFLIAFALGYLTEYLMIRHLYRRPLDTLLATWGLSLGMQQAFRSIFGAKEVSATLPDWLMGSWKPTGTIDIPLNGLFVMALTIALTLGIMLMLLRSDFGLQVRATVQNRTMANAVGINTKLVDRLTFALGCGIAGVAGAAFTTIGSTGPTSGSLYIVDTFLVVVFGGAQSLLGTVASAFGIAQAQSIARALVTNPKVLLLDEPTEGIQPSVIKDIARILNEIRKMRDITIIVSEQVLSFALEIADRLLVIEKGAFIHEDRRENVDAARISRYLSV